MKKAAVLALCLAACGDDDSSPRAADPLSGGSTTVFDATKFAYSNMSPTVTGDRANAFTFGHSLFKQNWVTAPATTAEMDGLGPVYNQRSCSSCHSDDGRAGPFDQKGNMLGMLVRISVPGTDEHGGPLGDFVYGTQIRPNAITGVENEATPHVAYEEVPGTYGDGTPYSLRKPKVTIDSWGYGEASPALMTSVRVGPSVFGLGLLEAIPEADILAGKTGHANHVWDAEKQAVVVGRFGWKANVPSVMDQTAGAFNGDMGITSSLFPNEACTEAMPDCKKATSGGTPEIDETRLTAIVFYMRTLAVPARRNVKDPKTLRGEDLFTSFGCAGCHTPTFRTAESYPALPEVQHQTIHPYTDLLVHDMGPDLADGRPDYEASGSEWRTAPLWGIGLLQTVNGHEFLLHDARARGAAEAILWHGGEATPARDRFRTANASDRDALLEFLKSL